ncbi:MAG: DNA repair protein RecO [Nitrospirae bacterium]|nr:DNA repair protein RecO [Nitrospirota bacterium]
MLQRTEGIVLRTIPYGEADLIATYLTKDLGIVKVFAKSPRKTKSRFGSSLEPLTFSRIAFWGKEDAALPRLTQPRLTQADIVHPFSSLRESLHCFIRVSELIEQTLHLVPERDTGRNVFPLLMNTLAIMEAGCRNPLIGLFYKLKLLEITGFLPGLHSCGRCGGRSNAFHLSHGTVLCLQCSEDEDISSRLSPGVTAFYSSLMKWEISKLDRLKPDEGIVKELSLLLDEHSRYITEKNLRSREFKRT